MDRVTLRGALKARLMQERSSVLAFAESIGLSRADYTSVNRWYRRKLDKRRRRAFGLALRLRLRLASELGFEGRVLTDGELGAPPPQAPPPKTVREKIVAGDPKKKRREAVEERRRRGQN